MRDARYKSWLLTVLLLVLAFNLFWLLPIAAFAFHNSQYGVLAALVAYVPIVVFCLRYGPLFQNQ